MDLYGFAQLSLGKVIRMCRGFTLFELLVVIAILGVIASLAIPRFSGYRTQTYNAASLSDLKNVKTLLEAYYADNQHYP